MDEEIDLSRWRDKPLGVNYRRMTIIMAGLQQLLKVRVIMVLVFVSWMAGFMIAALVYLVSQSVADGGWLEQFVSSMPGMPQATVKIIGSMLVLYPDVWVKYIYEQFFSLHSYIALYTSLLAILVMIPQLISKDRGTGALVVYLSRPLTSNDYLLGKLGMIAGVLLLTWTGPLLFGWTLSLLVSPSTDFLVYSISPLLRALAFNGIAFVCLAALALAVSALNRKSAGATMTWIGLWLLAGAVANFPDSPDWLRRASFTYDLKVLRKEAFQIDATIDQLVASMPLLNQRLQLDMNQLAAAEAPESASGAAIGMAVMTVAASVVFTRRLKPE